MDHLLFYYVWAFLGGFLYAFTKRYSLLQIVTGIAIFLPLMFTAISFIYETDAVQDHEGYGVTKMLLILSMFTAAPGLAFGTLFSKNWVLPRNENKRAQ